MASYAATMLTCNFSITTRDRKEAEELGRIVRGHYPDYRKSAGFNADDPARYYVAKRDGENVWYHQALHNIPPSEISLEMTLQEFKKKYIDKPEVVNDYQIY